MRWQCIKCRYTVLSCVLSAFYFHVFHVAFQLLLIYELFKYYLCPLAITVTVAIIVLLSSTHSFLQSTSSAQSLILKQERQAIGMELESNDLANLTHHTRRIDRFLPKDNNLIVRTSTRQEASSDTLSNVRGWSFVRIYLINFLYDHYFLCHAPPHGWQGVPFV